MERIMKFFKMETDLAVWYYAVLVALLALLLLKMTTQINGIIGGGWHYVTAAHFLA